MRYTTPSNARTVIAILARGPVVDSGGHATAQLATAAGLTPHETTIAVAELRRIGHAETVGGRGRCVRISITDAGAQAWRQACQPTDTEWIAHANCRRIDVDLFFPTRGEDVTQAKAVCAGCVVRDRCLDHALANGEKFGVWGGRSEKERRTLRRLRRRAT